MAGKSAYLSNPLVTHLAAAGLGLVAVWMIRADGEGAKDGGSAGESREFRSRQRADRNGHGLGGDALLTKITGISPGVREKRKGGKYSVHLLKKMEELSRRADEVAPADDVAVAARTALEKFAGKKGELSYEDYQDLEVRLLHWLREDPRAALATNFKRMPGGEQLAGVLSAAVKEKGIIAATEWFGVNPMADTELRNSLSLLAGAEGELGMMATLKSKMPPARWGEMRMLMAYSWTLEKGDNLLAFAKEENAPGFVLNFARTNGQEGTDWLREQMISGKIDPDLQAAIMKKPEYRELYLRGRNIPFDERLAVVSAMSPDKSQEEMKFTIGMQDVMWSLGEGRDWRYAFRAGAATFDEISAAVSADLPELAKSAPDAIRNQLLKELAEDNGDAVLASLEGLPEEEKWMAAIKPARSMFHSVNPQEFYDYIRQIPENAGGTVWQQRLDAWSNLTPGNHWRLEGDYVDWVRNLPDGLDRQMASLALLRNLNGRDPELAESLRAEVKDPRLVEQLGGMR